VIGVEEIPPSETKSYGIVDGKEWEDPIIELVAHFDWAARWMRAACASL
jgi:hypothetical protein